MTVSVWSNACKDFEDGEALYRIDYTAALRLYYGID